MPQATIVLLDNSEFSINGDYNPTRWICQIEAAGLLIQTKMEQDQQSMMGIGLSAGKQVQIICTPASDVGKVNSFLYGIKQHGLLKLCNALQTATLALKHRANQTLRQRVICFIASTITEGIEELKIICKKLKKNGIALDLIALGDLSQQQKKKVESMHEAVTNDSNSEVLYVDQNMNLSDALFSSKLFGGAQSNLPMNQAEDPQLLQALRMSLLEAEQAPQRNQPERRQNVNNNSNNSEMVDEEQLEERALQLSLEQANKEDKDEKKEDEKKQE